MSDESSGALVVSLDTELVWGMFDTGPVDPVRYAGTRSVIRNLLDLFDRYQIPVTWALVTHLLIDCRGSEPNEQSYSDSCERDNRNVALPCQQEMDPELWYEPRVLNWLENARMDHDIGSHTHTHLVFSESTREDARVDIEQSMAVAKRYNIDLSSFVYPRNEIDHQDLLSDVGFEVYRGINSRWHERLQMPTTLRKGARFAEETIQWTPPTVLPRTESGLVEVPGSQVFRPYHGGWQYTPVHSQRTRAIAGLNRAAQTGRIFHLWFHPFNFARNSGQLLNALEATLAHAEHLRDDDRLDVLTMRQVAEAYRNGRWERQASL
ncbi:polysaccharide deacetylase family protein [Salinirussus salinus]|uniref:polysaccharide deacetylase family protein n=1 Tax=Salinirussus salinus TaxID=1198300 RepID=UPI0013570171|nr:polysaccharide deacetylase family protein [Salinirussus salinus]